MFRLLLLALFVDAIFADSCKCGESSVGGRIIGGTRAQLGENPWQVKIEMKLGGGSAMCGGSIINERTILTAAHCSVDERNRPLNPRALSIIAGTVSTGIFSVKSENVFQVEKVIVHENYQPDTGTKNDIAMMILKTPITFSNKMRAVCLANDETPVNGVDLFISGYGRTDSGQTSDSQMEAVVRARSDAQCKTAWGYYYDPAKQICAISESSAVCNGDSGGPITSKSEGKFYQVGLVSYGSGLMCKNLDMPPVFTRVSYYRDWIERNLNSPLCK